MRDIYTRQCDLLSRSPIVSLSETLKNNEGGMSLQAITSFLIVLRAYLKEIEDLTKELESISLSEDQSLAIEIQNSMCKYALKKEATEVKELYTTLDEYQKIGRLLERL